MPSLEGWPRPKCVFECVDTQNAGAAQCASPREDWPAAAGATSREFASISENALHIANPRMKVQLDQHAECMTMNDTPSAVESRVDTVC